MKRFYKEEINHFSFVLLVDDNEIDNLINERLITTFGFAKQVAVRTTATSAIQLLENIVSQMSSLPEVIFLDYFMPEIDGIGFLERLEQLSEKYPGKFDHTQVMVLTSLKNPEKRKRLDHFENVAAVISKPLSKKALDRTFLHCTDHAEELLPG